MDLKDALIQSCEEVMPMFGISPSFLSEETENTLNSTDQVNILIGLTSGLKGNIVIGVSQNAALKVISAMMGGMKVLQIDSMGKSALGEMANMLVGASVMKCNSEQGIDLSPPTLAIGQNIFLMISRVQSQKLLFTICEELNFTIAFCIE